MREPDPQRLLAGMTRERLIWWRAAFRVVPLDDGWRQTDEICRAIQHMSERLFCAHTGTSLKAENLDPPGHYIPRHTIDPGPKVKIDQASIDRSERQTRNYGDHRITGR